MNKVVSCATCGLPISPGGGLYLTSEGVRHADWLVCVAALKADRDRYRGALVDLRDADLALEAASAAEDEALRTRRGREEAFAAFDAASRAISARLFSVANDCSRSLAV